MEKKNAKASENTMEDLPAKYAKDAKGFITEARQWFVGDYIASPEAPCIQCRHFKIRYAR
jgi:hypothetical protein